MLKSKLFIAALAGVVQVNFLWANMLRVTLGAILILSVTMSRCSGEELGEPLRMPTVNKAFQVARGIDVPSLSGIHEAYAIELAPNGQTIFTVNVSADRMEAVFDVLSSEVSEPGFLLLEVGTHLSIEKTLRQSSSDPFHKDLYYLDGISHQQLLDILKLYGELLIHDGGVNFGYGGRVGVDEVFVGPYKVLYIYTGAAEKYEHALGKLGFQMEDSLKTVWDNFTSESPGRRNTVTVENKTIWNVIDELKDYGLYFAERRED
ncbi:MAG: hypothetical protein ABI612_08095 [Betaproteobacteria bacterium]